MSVVSAGKEVVNSFMSPKKVLVGVALTFGTLWIMSNLAPGLGAMAGLRTNRGLLPIPFWPFQGGGMTAAPSAASVSSDDSVESAFWRANAA